MSDKSTAGQTDMTKLTVAIRNFAIAPKKTVAKGRTFCAGKKH